MVRIVLTGNKISICYVIFTLTNISVMIYLSCLLWCICHVYCDFLSCPLWFICLVRDGLSVMSVIVYLSCLLWFFCHNCLFLYDLSELILKNRNNLY